MAVAPPCDGLLPSAPAGWERAGPSRTIPLEMALTPLPDLILYGRAGCGLCDEARIVVTGLLQARREARLETPALVERDIETDPAWERAYFASIPVIELGDRRLELAISPAKIRRLLIDVLGA
jgi:hypothetical protein